MLFMALEETKVSFCQICLPWWIFGFEEFDAPVGILNHLERRGCQRCQLWGMV